MGFGIMEVVGVVEEERGEAKADLGFEKRREGEGIGRGERGLQAADGGREVAVEP